MAYCSSCGVELDDGLKACPLCGTRIASARGAGDPSTEGGAAEGGQARIARTGSGRFFAVEVLSVLAGLGALLCVGIDLWSTRGSLGWSLVALDAIAMGWILVAMPVVFARKPWLAFATIAPAELLLLFLLDLAEGGGIGWFPGMGMPIYLLSAGLLVGAGTLGAVSKRKGLNLLGLALAVAALECLGLEGIIALNLGKGLLLEWSPVVALACLPASGLAFYLHYRVVKTPLGRSLHL